MIDYHIHTPLCNHAHGSMEDYIRHAIGKGINEICFLDHLILDGPGKKHSMDVCELPLYVQAIANLKRKYQGRITIRTGLEVDFLPQKRAEIDDILGRFAFDVIGGSYHFVNGINVASRREAPKIGRDEEKKLVESYFEGICRMLERPYFDFICHPDIVKKTGIPIPQECQALINEMLTRISDTHVALEFNTGGWDHPVKDSYPSDAFVRKCFMKHIPFTIGSDAHSPERVGMHYAKAVSVLRSAGYTSVLTFEGRQAKSILLEG